MGHRVVLSCVVFLVSLISFASMASAVSKCMQEQCTYIVRVKIGDRDSAGTDSIINLKLKSNSGYGLTVHNLENWGLMGPGHDYFERGNLDVFSGSGPCVNICAICIISNGEGNMPGWYLDYVEITIVGLGKPTKLLFPANQWLALDEWPRHLYAYFSLCSLRKP